MTIRRRIAVALLVIVLAVITGFTAAYFISRGFRGEVHSDNTELFPIDTENCLEFIEEKYYLSEVPEGFEVFQTDSTPYYEYMAYKKMQTGQTIVLKQWVKSAFHTTHLNTEKGELVEADINGSAGVFFEVNSDCTLVIWDNGDYILELSADLTKDQLLDLAKSAKVL